MSTPITLIIDGQKVTAAQGQNVLDASLEAGIYIPHLCHHPKLTAQGGCKMCSVEIEGTDGAVSACETPAQENQVVRTKSERLTHLRQVAMELLLACHPADCTSCKAYLNCELQALMQYMGVAHSRLRRVEKENVSLADGAPNPLMKREMERCIQCGRCVRACDGLRGVGTLAYCSRDGETYVGVRDGLTLTEADCRFCGACVEVCPTGAIQDMPGIFPADVPREQALVPCRQACPAHTDIPTYLNLAGQQRYGEAAAVLREKLTFPQSLGYVCGHKCEAACKRSYLQQPVSIREVKRFIAESDKEQAWKQKVRKHPDTGKRISIVGAGPAGLTAAWHLARKGHTVMVMERQAEPGGMLRYGIPSYRLPKDIVANEVDILCDLGFTIVPGSEVASVECLREKSDAVLVAVGAQKGAPLPEMVKGSKNVWPAVDFCRWGTDGKLPGMGTGLTVIGGGNVAFDCARSAKKAGVPTVRIVCLEPREAMLCDDEELENALAEGIEVLNSRTCTGVERDGEGRIAALTLETLLSFRFGPGGLEMEIAPDSGETLPTTSMVFATGQRVDLDEAFGLELGRGNSVKTDAQGAASLEGVFAAGDAVTGTKTVVEAVASAVAVAAEIDKYLGGDGMLEEEYWPRQAFPEEIGVIEGFAGLPRQAHLTCPEDCGQETQRCLQCQLRLQIPRVRYWGDAHYQKKTNDSASGGEEIQRSPRETAQAENSGRTGRRRGKRNEV